MGAGDILLVAIAIAIGICVWVAIGYFLLRLDAMTPERSTLEVQVAATRALLKFCVDHRCDARAKINQLRQCLDAMEKGDVRAAVEKHKQLHFGPYGFDDWFPPVVFEHEDGGYVWEVFKALCERWSRLMSLLST